MKAIFYVKYSYFLHVDKRSNQGHTIMLHTYTPHPMSLPCINFLYLMVSEIQPGQDYCILFTVYVIGSLFVSFHSFP